MNLVEIETNNYDKIQESAFVHVYSCEGHSFIEYHETLYSVEYPFSSREKNSNKYFWRQEQWDNITTIEHHVDDLDKNRKKNPAYFYRFHIHTKRSDVGKKVDRILAKRYG